MFIDNYEKPIPHNKENFPFPQYYTEYCRMQLQRASERFPDIPVKELPKAIMKEYARMFKELKAKDTEAYNLRCEVVNRSRDLIALGVMCGDVEAAIKEGICLKL